jgi:hypothetical protein
MTDTFAERVGDEMRAAVEDVTSVDLYAAVRRRRELRRRRRRRRVAMAGLTATAALVAGTVALRPERSARVDPAGPTASASSVPTASPESPAPPVAVVPRHSLLDVGYVPAGFRLAHGAAQPGPAGLSLLERVGIAPSDDLRTQVIVDTTTEAAPVSVDDYKGVEKHVDVVRIGTRSVIRVRRDPGEGFGYYTWNEEPGLVVLVEGRDVPDTEVRKVIAGLRRRDAAPPLVVRYTGRTTDPQGVQWAAATVVDERTIELLYNATPGGCRVLSEVDVAEAENEVVVTLREARPLPATGQRCMRTTALARTRVELAAPLGSRFLYDSSSGATRPVRR